MRSLAAFALYQDADTVLVAAPDSAAQLVQLRQTETLGIFNDHDAYKNFIYSGWKFGVHADAAAKAGDKGGEASGEGMFGNTKVYSMTESGLALQATVAGTKYWKDDELN